MRLAIAALAAVWLVAGLPSAVRAQASFDCSRAATPVEHMICADPQLTELDGEMGRRYFDRRAALRGQERQDMLDEQVQWLDSRAKRCQLPPSGPIGADQALQARPCLVDAYRRRIAQLEPPSPPPARHTPVGVDTIMGRWFYVVSDGEMIIAQGARGHIDLSIETVSGPTFHTCSLDTGEGRFAGDTLSVRIEDDDYSLTPPRPGVCMIAIRFVGDRAFVDADGAVCRNFCGARGIFQGEYRRK
jgi:uncharacterized protein